MYKVGVTIGMVIALTFCASLLEAQKILGLVVEKNAEGVDEPLPGANVVWLGTSKGTTTGENGVFMIERAEGFAKLVVSYVGYRSDTILITNQTSIKVILQSDEYLKEVTVQGWKPTTGVDHSRGINTVIMTEKELFKAACCNLSESFETNPSVDVAFTDAITGTTPDSDAGISGTEHDDLY
jgi:outer membrane receptor for ferrienterochelin and colicins